MKHQDREPADGGRRTAKKAESGKQKAEILIGDDGEKAETLKWETKNLGDPFLGA